jgi:trans-aconitate 2-methyltransferase
MWSPETYNRFAAEREQPFWDLVGLIEAPGGGVVVDLGCGDGRLTALLHRRLEAERTHGIDSSPAMLASALAHATADVTFERRDIGAWSAAGVDLVVSNAALQWVSDHPTVLARWRASLAPGGQLAVQVPANGGHASHAVARELGREWLGERAPSDPVAANVLEPEAYAAVLHGLELRDVHVRLQVYLHELDSTAAVVEWVKGTSLARFKDALGADGYERFVAEYRRRLVAELGDRSPYLYTFRRILMSGRADR